MAILIIGFRIIYMYISDLHRGEHTEHIMLNIKESVLQINAIVVNKLRKID